MVRNAQFYFREGLCWSDINTTFLKCRKKQCSVNDVKSMSLYGVSAIVPEDYIITLLNSTFFSYYVDTFVNNTQTFQINDARQLPVIVPTLDTIERTHILLRRAVAIKQQAGPHEDSLLEKLQKEVDTLVLKIYGLCRHAITSVFNLRNDSFTPFLRRGETNFHPPLFINFFDMQSIL